MSIEEILKIRKDILSRQQITNCLINNRYKLATIREDGTVLKWGKNDNFIEVKKVNSIELNVD